MKKFVDTFWGKFLLATLGVIAIPIILLLGSVLITAWEQPDINKNIYKEIRQGDSSIKETLKVRDNILLEKMSEYKEGQEKFDKKIDDIYKLLIRRK